MSFGFLIQAPLPLSSILSSIWLAIIMGVRWEHVKWSEIWMIGSHSYYGWWGDDSVINAEFQNFPVVTDLFIGVLILLYCDFTTVYSLLPHTPW